MSVDRSIKRKRNRKIKKLLWVFCYVILIFILGVGGYFLFTRIFPKQLYISPLSKIKLAVTTVQSGEEKDHLKKLLHDNRIEFNKITASGSKYVVELKSGSLVTLSSNKDLQSQISSLQYILSRLTMEGKQFRTLDLQFDKPVIKLR